MGQTYVGIIANRIRVLCRQRGRSINQLAEISGVAQSTIDNILHGRSRNPGVQTLHKLANALHMTLAEFLDFQKLNAYSFDEQED